jgi:hypothetical protein
MLHGWMLALPQSPARILGSSNQEGQGMCVSCGCGKLNDNHGDPRNITMDQIQQAASAANCSPEDVARNIQKGASQRNQM